MKRCPKCRNEFRDDNDFCPDDGTLLSGAGFSEETVVLSTPRSMPSYATPSPVVQSQQPPYAMFAVILFLAVVAVGSGVAYFVSVDRTQPAEKVQNVNEKVRDDGVKAPTSADKNIAPEISRETLRPAAAGAPPAPPQTSSAPIVTVDSPRDGFLALRSEPSHKTGFHLRKIPHYTRIALGECQDQLRTIGSRTGRWCYVAYDGAAGWIFTGWVF